jgi:hypothetical protein
VGEQARVTGAPKKSAAHAHVHEPGAVAEATGAAALGATGGEQGVGAPAPAGQKLPAGHSDAVVFAEPGAQK